jgi:hypothetical protein
MGKRKTPKQIREEKTRKRKIFLVRFGVYVAMLLGVVGSQALVMADDLALALKPIELSQVAGAALIAGVLYTKLENKKGEDRVLSMEGKIQNLGRLMRNAVYHGFFWMTVMGAWW